jgi:Zn-dependent protease
MRIERITPGKPDTHQIVGYTGWLYREDTDAAYDELAAGLRPLGITPLFRWEKDRHSVILVSSLPQTRTGNPLVNLVLFALTLVSVLMTGVTYSYTGEVPADLPGLLRVIFQNLGLGWPFAASLLAILLAHEFGHYLAGRFHHTRVSLPYFIPLPLPGSIGTMGAFINMKEPPKNRRILLDIGLAGPLAGLVVAIPVLILGLSMSDLSTIPSSIPAGTAYQLEGNSLLYLLSKFAVFGQLLPAPASYGAAGPLSYWVRYFFTGQPHPLGALDVMLHPVAWAGWVGLLVTALNLIPAGQLDGGHLLYVLFGSDKARRILPFILTVLVGLGFFWNGWWLWAGIIFLLGRFYAEPLDQITPLNPARKALATFGLLIFLLVFSPAPLVILMQ